MTPAKRVKAASEIEPSRTDRGTEVFDLQIRLDPSGMAHLNGVPMRNDEQLLANVAQRVAEARSSQAARS
jgi:hypothetical protein